MGFGLSENFLKKDFECFFVITQVQYVLKALHNLAHGKAVGTNEKENPCPVGATQENNKRSCVAPTGQKKRRWAGNLGLRPRLGCAVLSAHSFPFPNLSSYIFLEENNAIAF